MIGYCDGLSAGRHELQIWLEPFPEGSQGDCHTGWHKTKWMLEVEEIN